MNIITKDKLDLLEDHILRQNIFYEGRLLFKKDDIVNKDMIEQLKLLNNYPYFLISQPNCDIYKTVNNILNIELENCINKIAKFYSYETDKDENLFEIISIIIKNKIKDTVIFNKLLMVIRYGSRELFLHSMYVSIVSCIIALKMSVSYKEIENIVLGGLLHDIGLVSLMNETPELSLYFTELSYKRNLDIVKNHTILGMSLVDDIPNMTIKRIILLHHVWEKPEKSYKYENEDYSSFPVIYQGNIVTKEDKDKNVRIIQLADYFCKNIFYKEKTKYSYNKQVLKNIHDKLNIEFGYKEGKILLNLFSPYRIGEIVKLPANLYGEVFKHTKDPYRPLLKINNEIVTANFYSRNIILD